MLQPPQFAGSLTKLKPSSTTPLQSLSRPSHASTPPFVFTHSQPLAGLLSASKKPAKQVDLQTPFTQAGSALGTRHEVKQVPQFEMSVRRSGELLLQEGPPPPSAPVPPFPPIPALPPLPPLPARPPDP